MGNAADAANPANQEIKEVSPLMWGGMLALALLCFIIGVYPQIVFPVLNESTRAISAMTALP
jgi:formate hydrogenlyase subunit 3/multisubunit Na+/H+ antiporter MnhD subunit